MFELAVAAALVLAVVGWLILRPNRIYDVGAGVKHNLKRLTRRLDHRGVKYETEIITDGSFMYDAPVSAGGGALMMRRRNVEMTIACVRVRDGFPDGEDRPWVKKSATIHGATYPYPSIRLNLEPSHCWGFEPHSLVRFNRDPKWSWIKFELDDIEPNDLTSQTISDEIMEIAARYLAHDVSAQLVDLWHEKH